MEVVDRANDHGNRPRDERGASVMEYALLLALIAIVCIVAITAIGSGLSDSYGNSTSSIFGG